VWDGSARVLVKSTAIFAVLLLIAAVRPVRAQDNDSSSISLGDLARSLRKSKEAASAPAPPAKPVIDNDNLNAVMEDVASHRPPHSLAFSFDSLGKKFKVSSSPDVTCSLSFNANSTALISDPYASRDLPAEELSKLEGPATISGDTLEIAVHNRSGWSLKEITVGLTLLRRGDAEEAYMGPARIITASQTALPGSAPLVEEKRSDVTVLYHIRGAAAPESLTVFKQVLGSPLAADQEWHWAIVEAKGYPPQVTPQAETPSTSDVSQKLDQTTPTDSSPAN